jgi:hypothetical protein
MSNEVLGKGRTSIFRSPETEEKPAKAEVRSTESEVCSAESEVQSSKLEFQHTDTIVQTSDSDARIAPTRIDPQILQQALNEADAKSKITIWNPEVSAVLRYMQLTTVRYSMSKEASILLEKAVKKAYPDVWRAVKECGLH